MGEGSGVTENLERQSSPEGGRVPMDEVTAGLERWEAWCDANGLASEDYVGFVVGLQSEQTVWSCSACGGLVLDRYCHVRWHLGEHA